VHFADTMRGGGYLNNWRMAELHAKEAPDRVRELEAWGALMDRTPDGRILQRNFGGHAYPRLAHVGDRTGLEMIRTLQDHGVHQGIDVHMEVTVTTLLKDAERHGVCFRPIDVTRSAWRCSIEDGAVRLGLRSVACLRPDAAERRVAIRPNACVADAAQRGALARDEGETLAHAGAFASFGLTRRAALWQAAAIERDRSSLLARLRPAPERTTLPEMNALEETAADYATAGLTIGPHLMAHHRSALRARGILPAATLRSVRHGAFVRTAGHVIVRQRPGTAKGMCFLTLEDETGLANAFLTPPAYERFRLLLNTSSLLVIAGVLEQRDGVTHLRVRDLERLNASAALPEGHDYR